MSDQPQANDTWRRVFEAVPDEDGQLLMWSSELGLPGELAKDRVEAEAAVTDAARSANER